MATLRFCAYQYQHLALDELARRWRSAEELGFDVVWNCDTVVEPDRPRHVMHDGPTTLTLMACGDQSHPRRHPRVEPVLQAAGDHWPRPA